jgi:hypothetical protein
MDLKLISEEIREILDEKRKKIQLTFVEDQHVYYMKGLDGKIHNNFPSVSKIVGKFHTPFDSNAISLRMAKGDKTKQLKLLSEWREAGVYSSNMGSRVHFELETEVLSRFENNKKIRRPIFEINTEQELKSNEMVSAGKKFLNLMEERNAYLLDTEMILGDPDEGYVGQPDTVWLMENKKQDRIGIVITDWKSNQPKNFEVHRYTGKLFPPFSDYHDNALGHYYLQVPLYARLITKMLMGTKYSHIPYFGGVIVLLKDDGNFVEFKVPLPITNKILKMDLSKYI